VSGYEIHMGRTRATAPVETPFRASAGGASDASLGAATDRILGTYLHGLFENDWALAAFVDSVFAAAGRERPSGATEADSPHDRAAALVADVDLAALGLDRG
jgi:adenosylcobyric acid synthase